MEIKEAPVIVLFLHVDCRCLPRQDFQSRPVSSKAACCLLVPLVFSSAFVAADLDAHDGSIIAGIWMASLKSLSLP